MSAWAETLLDRLECGATKARPTKTPFQRWLVRIIPDSALLPTEYYSWPLFFRVASPPGISVVLLIMFVQIIVWAAVWYIITQLFENPKYHKILIGRLSHEGIYDMLPLTLLFLLLFNYTLYLPRRHFWNRRAARLRREPPEPQMVADENVKADPSIWPPPPNRK